MPLTDSIKHLALAAGLSALGSAALAQACLLACARSADCKVGPVVLEDKKPPKDEKQPDSRAFKDFTQCDKIEVKSGHVLMRYRHKGQWFSPPQSLGQESKLALVFGAFPADACSVTSSSCIQLSKIGKSNSQAGHGVDSQASTPAGEGEPCAKGWPCGMVLPPTTAWRFRLADPQSEGQWQVRLVRGTPPAGAPREFNVPFSQGQMAANGTQFQPGGVYAYRWLDGDGRQIASGEFSIMAGSRLEMLRKIAADRAARDGLSDSDIGLDVLLANQLDWDANQRLAR